MEIRPEISKVGLLFAKSSNFCRIRVTPQHSIGVLERSLGNLRRRPSAFFADAPIGCRLPSRLLGRGERERKARQAWLSHPPGTMKPWSLE
jgi:hypothetical protein